MVLFAVAGIAALFCNIASSAGFALIVPDRRQLGDKHLVDEPLEPRERAVEAVAHLHVRGHRAECHLQLVRRARIASGTIIGSLRARLPGQRIPVVPAQIDANVDLT